MPYYITYFQSTLGLSLIRFRVFVVHDLYVYGVYTLHIVCQSGTIKLEARKIAKLRVVQIHCI